MKLQKKPPIAKTIIIKVPVPIFLVRQTPSLGEMRSIIFFKGTESQDFRPSGFSSINPLGQDSRAKAISHMALYLPRKSL
jgi:hypothetical protein